MCITLTARGKVQVVQIFSCGKPKEEEAFPLLGRVIAPDFNQLVCENSGMYINAILRKKTLKINVRVADSDASIRDPIEAGRNLH